MLTPCMAVAEMIDMGASPDWETTSDVGQNRDDAIASVEAEGSKLMEQAVVGSMILDYKAVAVFRAKTARLRHPLRLFMDGKTRLMAEVILQQNRDGVAICYATVIHGCLKERPDKSYMVNLRPKDVFDVDLAVGDPGNISQYMDFLLEQARLRAVKKRAMEALQATNSAIDSESLIRTLRGQLDDILVADEFAAFTPTKDSAMKLMVDLTSDMCDNGVVQSCFAGLNHKTGAWGRGQVHVVGATPGMGKTAFMLAEAFHATRAKKQTAYCVLMESNREQVFIRFCAQHYGVMAMPASKWGKREWEKSESDRVLQATHEFGNLESRLYLDLQRPMSGDEIAEEVDAFAQKNGAYPDLVIVDHLQTMREPEGSKFASNEHGAIHANLMALWELAARSNAAVLLASQFAKDTLAGRDQTKVKRPTIGALKGSGTIMEKAKTVVLLHEPRPDKERMVREVEFVIDKANDGSTGVIPGLFIAPLTLFMEDTPENRGINRETLARFGWKER